MVAEAEWMKTIQNETICSFFYAFFIIYSIVAIFAFATGLGIVGMSKDIKGYIIFGKLLFTSGIAFAQALFFYLICNRALLQKTVEQFLSFNFSFSF
jgi:hypothetical protein